ncbi:eukaryotic translation initiation factor 3 subunit G [Myxozyma melibiosi]|uniref:Eukaryotic translation initiation factor 3 subunit G n=1 Tax=Myxozyma melibiosi TaxID=54550 RepID=A0ABR1F6L2_9ASCO
MPDIATKPSTTNWADDDDDNGFPAPLVTVNPDGTKTVISYRVNEAGKKVKVTQKIKTTTQKETVNPDVAARKRWAKFGLERGSRPGPDAATTSVGENTPLKLIIGWKESKEEEVKVSAKESAKAKAITCRTCGGEHFTSRCPYKDRLPSADVVVDSATPSPRAGTPEPAAAASSGSSRALKSAYVPPHLRNRGSGAPMGEGEKMGGYKERDDSTTLRVSNIGEDAEEHDLELLFGRFGRLQRIFLAKDRDTGRSKGFAFISYTTIKDAQDACNRLNGYGFQNLILRVEFSQRKPNA